MDREGRTEVKNGFVVCVSPGGAQPVVERSERDRGNKGQNGREQVRGRKIGKGMENELPIPHHSGHVAVPQLVTIQSLAVPGAKA